MTEIADGIVVTKIPITDLVFIFIAYLAIHIMIALLYKSKEKKLNALKAISTEPSDKLIEEEKQTKILKTFLLVFGKCANV